MLRFEYDYNTVLKLYMWAQRLPDDVDFIDYWYNLFLSDTKARIDDDNNNLGSFWLTRWMEDFEQFYDKYERKPGDGFSENERIWFAMYTQYLVYELQLSSKEIALHYGKQMFINLMDEWFKYHTFGTNLFMDHFAEMFGLPPGVEKPYRVVNC